MFCSSVYAQVRMENGEYVKENYSTKEQKTAEGHHVVFNAAIESHSWIWSSAGLYIKWVKCTCYYPSLYRDIYFRVCELSVFKPNYTRFLWFYLVNLIIKKNDNDVGPALNRNYDTSL